MIDKEQIAEIRADGANDGLREALRLRLRHVLLQIDNVIKGEYIDAGAFRTAMIGAKAGIEDAETLAAELERAGEPVREDL